MLTEQRKAELLQKISSGQNVFDVFFESISERQSLEEVEFLVANGADVNTIGYNRVTLLHTAIRTYNFEIVKFLVEKGAIINVQGGQYGDTPLHLACAFQINLDNVTSRIKFNIVQFLVNHGAIVNAKNYSNNTPLHLAYLAYAASYKNFNIVQFLFEQGADVNAINLEGKSVLDLARTNNDNNIVNFLTQTIRPKTRLIVDTSVNDTGDYKTRMTCPICLTNEKKIKLTCGHMLCKVCSDRVDKCPECRTPITTRDTVYYNKYLKYKNKYLALKKML